MLYSFLLFYIINYLASLKIASACTSTSQVVSLLHVQPRMCARDQYNPSDESSSANSLKQFVSF